MEIIQWCVGIGVVILWGCYSKLSDLVSHLEMINKCACDIRLETEGLSHRFNDLEDSLEKLNDQVKGIATVAKDYDYEILSPISKQRREVELDREIFG